MKEAILSTHTGKSSPTTNLLNESQYQIDGIWCNLVLTTTRAGYSKFKENTSLDHRVLWIKFLLMEVFGTKEKNVKKWLKLKQATQGM